MAKRANFTAERIARFQCEPGRQQTIHWDGKTPGLGLRVTAAGAKSYVFETSLCGKTLRITIGDPRTWSIGKAQAKATELKTLTDQDIDPRQLRSSRPDTTSRCSTPCMWTNLFQESKRCKPSRA
ncbi:MAG: Arm DNA-binding domain-containing protein [Gammaproteobacteria bacterium]|nr:Arm DNA-binding domain-containing protein [Gammaproteobacteria bacterium]